MDYENDELEIVRTFENGLLFTGTGVIGEGKGFSKGNWKMEGVSAEVRDGVR